MNSIKQLLSVSFFPDFVLSKGNTNLNDDIVPASKGSQSSRRNTHTHTHDHHHLHMTSPDDYVYAHSTVNAEAGAPRFGDAPQEKIRNVKKALVFVLCSATRFHRCLARRLPVTAAATCQGAHAGHASRPACPVGINNSIIALPTGREREVFKSPRGPLKPIG